MNNTIFTASDLARFCQVNHKTIHNWVEQERIKHFRTPGRHLRFRRLDVLHFMRDNGYPVPAIVSQLGAPGSSGKFTVIIIESNSTKVPELINGLKDEFDIRTFARAQDVIEVLDDHPPDIIVLNAMDVGAEMTRLLKAAEEKRILSIVLAGARRVEDVKRALLRVLAH